MALAGFVLGLFSAGSLAYPTTNQFSTYLSRPDLKSPLWEISIYNESHVSPGYVIMTPYTAPLDSNLAGGSVPTSPTTASLTPAEELALIEEIDAEALQNGPYVFDQDGGLMYSGYGSAGAQYSHDLKIAQYDGSSHLTFYNGNDAPAGNRGLGIIMDSTYRTVTTVSSGNGRSSNDIHEFTVLPGGTALITIFQPTQFDLTPYGIDQPWGWVTQGIFQEIDIATGEVVFEWKSLDHVPPSQSYNDAAHRVTGGNGSTVEEAWDYFHLNSVEKDSDGDYLISSRYVCALFKISGKDGSIIWQLNGMANEFNFEGFPDTPFAFQHHARTISQTNSTAIISLFDNGSDGNITNSTYSSARIMSVDSSRKTCTLLNEYILPDPVSSTSQGSVQVLSNASVFVGWGSRPYVSEFTADGNCVFKAQFASNQSLSESYRAFKADWAGHPDSTPALWSYANGTSSATSFYTSWNGATEIATWNFYGGSTEYSNFTLLGTQPRTGFEVSFTANEFHPYGYSEAVDINGSSLGKSPVTRTYIVGQA